MTVEVAAALDASFHMWAVFALIVGALALYASERLPMEVTSFGVICALLIFFQMFPVAGDDGANRLGTVRILEGFANPALVTVVTLLVMGEGMARTGILDQAPG
jgi:di/tricarboxylate transporter